MSTWGLNCAGDERQLTISLLETVVDSACSISISPDSFATHESLSHHDCGPRCLESLRATSRDAEMVSTVELRWAGTRGNSLRVQRARNRRGMKAGLYVLQ